MTIGNRIATVAFWVVAIGVAAIFAWYNIRPDIARTNPWLFSAAFFLCAVAVFGVRECIRAVRGQPITPTKSATALFWIGVVTFFGVAGIVTWAVLSK